MKNKKFYGWSTIGIVFGLLFIQALPVMADESSEDKAVVDQLNALFAKLNVASHSELQQQNFGKCFNYSSGCNSQAYGAINSNSALSPIGKNIETNKKKISCAISCQSFLGVASSENPAPVRVAQPAAPPAPPAAAPKPACPLFANAENQKGGLACPQLYGSASQGCFWNGSSGVSLDSDSYSGFQDLVEGMKPSDGKLFQGETSDGRDVKVGIVRGADGSYSFSSDGTHYYGSLQRAVAPSLLQRLTAVPGNVWGWFSGLFGVGKYTGKNTLGNSAAQERGQEILDASTVTLGNFLADLQDRQKHGELIAGAIERFNENPAGLPVGNLSDALIQALKEQTGCDISAIKDFIDKISTIAKLTALDAEKARELTLKLATIPASAVTTLAEEVRNGDFAGAATLYIKEREEGKSPSVIFNEDTKDHPELDYVTSIAGYNQQFYKREVYAAYEESYQRFLLAKELKK